MHIKQEGDQQAKKDEQKKIKLEQLFAREIRNLFTRINRENTQNIIATGNAISANKFKDEWEALLRKHFTRVQNAFEGEILEMNPDLPGLTEEEQEILLLALINFRDKKAKEESGLITQTNKKQISESMQSARAIILEQEKPTDRKTLALTTAVIFRRKYKPRVELIASVGVQAVAEDARLRESVSLSGADPVIVDRPSILPIKMTSTKTWLTFGDKKVRAAHVKAGIEQLAIPMNKPFFVGGEFLMHPGDRSLGASAKNVIKCRCSQFFDIK